MLDSFSDDGKQNFFFYLFIHLFIFYIYFLIYSLFLFFLFLITHFPQNKFSKIDLDISLELNNGLKRHLLTNRETSHALLMENSARQ